MNDVALQLISEASLLIGENQKFSDEVPLALYIIHRLSASKLAERTY